MSDSDDHRMRAAEFSRLAKEAKTQDERDKFLRMEQSYRLLAKNADWIDATGTFIREMRTKPLKLPTRPDGRLGRRTAGTNAS